MPQRRKATGMEITVWIVPLWHGLKGRRLLTGVQHGNKAESEILKER